MFRKTTELTELRAQKDLLSSTLKQREASLEAARDDNLRLLSVLSQRPKETVVSELSSAEDLAGELRECQRQRDELEVYLQHLLQDMEDKTPLLEGLRSNYDALRHNYDQLLQAWNQNLKWAWCYRVPARATTPSSVSLLFHSELKRLQSEVASLQEQNALLEKQRDVYRLHLLQRGDISQQQVDVQTALEGEVAKLKVSVSFMWRIERALFCPDGVRVLSPVCDAGACGFSFRLFSL